MSFDSLTPSFLDSSSATHQFLSEHLSFAKRLGSSQQAEEDFLKRTEGGFFNSEQAKGSAFFKSYGNSKRASGRGRMIQGQFSNARRPMANKGLRVDTNTEISVRGDYETARFLSNNSHLVAQVNSDSGLMNSLLNGSDTQRKDIEKQIAKEAAGRLEFASPINEEFLEKNSDLARFILLDIGGITDVLNKNNDLAKAITRGGFNGEEIIRERTAQKAFSLLHNRSKITEDFLKENTAAAIYLIQNPAEARELDKSRSKATDFVDTFETLKENTVESSIASEALSLLSGTGVTLEFLENNMDFAEIIVADELVNDGPSLAGYIKSSGSLSEIIQRVQSGEVSMDSSGINVSGIISEQQAELAVRKLSGNFPLDEEFFKKNVALSFLVNQSDEFQKALSDSKGTVERFIGADSNNRAVMDAFLLGYAERKSGNSLNVFA